MKKIIIFIALLFAVSAEAVQVCYDNSAPTVVTAIGKSKPGPGETCFNYMGSFVHGRDVKFYTVSGGALSAKSQSTVGAIKAATATKRSAVVARPGSAKSALAGYAAIIKRAQNYNNVLSWAQNNFPTLTTAEHADLARIVHMLALSIRASHSKDDTFFNNGE